MHLLRHALTAAAPLFKQSIGTMLDLTVITHINSVALLKPGRHGLRHEFSGRLQCHHHRRDQRAAQRADGAEPPELAVLHPRGAHKWSLIWSKLGLGVGLGLGLGLRLSSCDLTSDWLFRYAGTPSSSAVFA